MSIREVHISETEEWDYCVRKFPGYDVFYLNSYLRAFQLQGSGEPILIIYANGSDYAVNAVFRRDVSKDRHFIGRLEEGRYFDLSTPYGYGGFIGNVSDTDALMSEWNSYCVEHGYICEFVRFHLFTEYKSYYDGEVESRTHNVVRSLEMPLDQMWMDFKQKVRKNVKRANSHNLKIIIDDDGKYMDDFLRIYYGTMERSDAEDEYFFSKEFFEIISSMHGNAVFFHVEYEDKIISTELVIYGADTCYSYLGGTDREYFDLRPNDFLKYEVIKWAKEMGLKNYVLGGGYGADDGIFQYKACLAPHGIQDFYIGRKIYDKESYDRLVKLRQGDIENTGYFPLYRA